MSLLDRWNPWAPKLVDETPAPRPPPAEWHGFHIPQPVNHPMAAPIVVIQPVKPERDPFSPTGSQQYYEYLSGLKDIRNDNLLDGLIGGQVGRAGGGWSNPVTGMGTFERDKVMQGRYEEPYRIDDPQLSALYNGNDLAQRVVAAKPKEMFRRGWVLVFGQEDDHDGDEDSQHGSDPEERAANASESGPAAPGSPLVDPMGAAPSNASGRSEPGVTKPATRDDPESGHPLADPTALNKAPRGNETAAVGGAGALKRSPDNAMSTAALTPSKAAPGAERGALAAPVGESQKTPQSNEPPTTPAAPPQPTGEDTQMKPGSNRKPAAKPGAAKPEDGQGAAADLANQVEEYAANLGLIPRMLEATVFGRLYGGGLLILGADDGQDMALPLNEDNIKTMRYLAWIDRRFVFAATWYAEIGPKYGEVETWEIINPFGGQSNTRIHESRVIRFDGAPVDFLMRRRLLGWSLSVLQAPYDVLRQFDQSFQSIANLMADMSQAVMKINKLTQMISHDQQTLNTRMRMVDMSRSSGRMLYIDAENEEFSREPTPLTGVSDTLQMQMLRVSAAADTPVAIIFGREPSGLNATGDADFRRFYDTIAGDQKNYLEPKLRRAYTVICKAKDSPTGGQVPPMQFVWHKLYEPSEKEQAEIRWLMAQSDEKYVANQICLPEEIATSRFRNGDLHLDTEIDLDLRREALETAALPPSGAEKAEQDQQNALAEQSIKAAGVAAKGGPPGADGPPKPGGGPPKPGAGAPPKKPPSLA